MSIQSPCVSLCKLDDNEVCTGCYRKLEEIVNWSKSDDQYKVEVINALEKRKQQYHKVS